MGSENISSLRSFFDGSDYPQWKFKMELYLDSDHIKLWDVILDGWEPPKGKVDDEEVVLKRSQWNQTQKDENHKNKKSYDHTTIFHV